MDIVRFKGFNLDLPVHVVLPDVGHVEHLLGTKKTKKTRNPQPFFSTISLVIGNTLICIGVLLYLIH